MKDPDNFSTFLPQCGRYELFDFLEDLKSLWRDVELKSITDGHRKVNVFYLNQSDFDNQLERLSDMGLLFQPLARIKSFDNFGHKHEISEQINGDTSIYGVVSSNTKDLKKFKEFYSENDDFNMGLMLGYPECCCRAFGDYVRRGIIDPVFEIARNTPGSIQEKDDLIETSGIPWQLQVHLRYLGLRIIPFLPCSLLCESALEEAEYWRETLKRTSPETFATLETLMKQPSTWDLYNSQVIVNKPPFKAPFMGYATSTYYPGRKVVQFLDVQQA